MIPEKEREALMRLTMCAREECGMCKYTYTCNFDFQYELATKNMNILADALNADRKTENSSEKPNNCEPQNYCDDCLYTDTCDSKEFFYACTSKATISKMEQVEQRSCDTCKGRDIEGWKNPCLGCTEFTFYEPKDEPQTPMCETCRYDEPNNPKCDECIAGEDKPSNYEPQTDCPWK